MKQTARYGLIALVPGSSDPGAELAIWRIYNYDETLVAGISVPGDLNEEHPLMVKGATASAQTIEELQRLYRTHCRARAEGGWWALSGFSFQTAAYLFRYFERLCSDNGAPEELAKVERLSDIFQANDDGEFRLLQVKRTLDHSKLLSALEEAFTITSLCSENLLSRIRFQILCRRDLIGVSHADLILTNAGSIRVAPETWAAMIDRFDHVTPVLVDDDPLDKLHHLLWVQASEQHNR